MHYFIIGPILQFKELSKVLDTTRSEAYLRVSSIACESNTKAL